MTSKCLICDTEVPLTNGINALPKGPKKYRTSDPDVIPPVLCDRTKFALTNIQYTVLHKVLALPDEACKTELLLGPYCRECFTNINNVCHCMSALENLQQSVLEFRKEFSSKMLKSCGGILESALKRKRKSVSDLQTTYSARNTILNYLNNSVFPVGVVPVVDSTKTTKHIHETISNMDPNTQSPDTHVEAEMVVCTTNGNMPTLKRVSKVKTVKSSKKMPKLPPKKKNPAGSLKPIIIIPPSKLLTVVINNHSSSKIAQMAEEYDEQPEHKCWCCSKICQTDEELKKHEEIAHRKKCTFSGCTKVFYTQKSLTGHFLKTHKVAPVVTAPKKLIDVRRTKKCEDCSRYFPNYQSLTAHKIKEHNHKRHKPILKNPNKAVTTRPGRCKVCKKIVMDVQAHIRTQHPEVSAARESNGLSSKTSGHEISTRRVSRNTANPEEEEPKVEIKTETADKLPIIKTEPSVLPTIKKETPVISPKLSPPPKKATSFTFQVPAAIIGTKLPSPTSNQGPAATTASSKYQFKNLLKIGDKN